MKISVIMPSYNQGKYLEKAILSVLDQNYTDLEFIIMDGGSSDDSVEIIKKYQDRISYWQSQPDNGQSAAINAGMEKATGEICCWLNSDDYYLPNTLNKISQFFMEHKDTKWLITSGEVRTIKNKTLETIKAKQVTYEGLVSNWGENWVHQPSVFWKKTLWDDVQGLDESLDLVMDYELWLKFSKLVQPNKLDILSAVTLYHDAAKSVSFESEQYAEMCIVLYNKGEKKVALQKLGMHIGRAFKIYKMIKPLLQSKLYRKIKNKLT